MASSTPQRAGQRGRAMRSSVLEWIRTGAVVLAGTALIAGAAAQAALRTGTLGKGKGSGPLLTRAELRECLAQQARIRAAADGVASAQATLDKEKSELQRRGLALKDELAALDRTSADAVAAYNAAAQEHDKRVDAYNTQSATFNSQVQDWQAQRASYAKN